MRRAGGMQIDETGRCVQQQQQGQGIRRKSPWGWRKGRSSRGTGRAALCKGFKRRKQRRSRNWLVALWLRRLAITGCGISFSTILEKMPRRGVEAAAVAPSPMQIKIEPPSAIQPRRRPPLFPHVCTCSQRRDNAHQSGRRRPVLDAPARVIRMAMCWEEGFFMGSK
jgi:hypothetical protein